MRRKIPVLVAIAALVTGVSLFAAPSISHAVIINSVTVTIGNNVFSLAGWGPFPVTLNFSDTLVLASTGGGQNFNFDTSDVTCSPSPCGNPVVTVNGIQFTDTTKVLTVNNADHGTFTLAQNEAQGYTNIGSVPGSFEVLVAYADNVHPNACGADVPAPLVGNPNCLPTPFTGATFFRGTSNAEFDASNSNHPPCTSTSTSGCWDSGVIQIHGLTRPVPEPSSLLLLGTGLVGLAVWGRRHLKKSP